MNTQSQQSQHTNSRNNPLQQNSNIQQNADQFQGKKLQKHTQHKHNKNIQKNKNQNNDFTQLNINKLHFPSKRHKTKSLPLKQFERETRKNKKRRYSDFSEFKSTRIRLNGLETSRSHSPNNRKKRRLSDIFESDQHKKYKLQAQVNIIDNSKLNYYKLSININQIKMCKITEIISKKDILIALTNFGLAVALNRRNLHVICYLNINNDEEIQSVFYNNLDDSFIICSIFKSELNQKNVIQRLRIRSVPIRYIRLGQNKGKEILLNEFIAFPGWLEWDDTIYRMLSYNHIKKRYRLWNMKDYSIIYEFINKPIIMRNEYYLINDITNIDQSMIKYIKKNQNKYYLPKCKQRIEDVKLTADGLIESGPINLQLKMRTITIRSLNENKILISFNIDVGDSNDDEISFSEYHNGYFYFKANENSPLTIYDCRNITSKPIFRDKFDIPDAFLFLKKYNRSLTYKIRENVSDYHKYSVFDFITGNEIIFQEQQKGIKHHESILFVTEDSSKIIYYGKYCVATDNNGKKKYNYIIQINSLNDGKLFGFIKWNSKNNDNHKNRNNNNNYLSPRWCLSAKTNKERDNTLIKKNPLKRMTAIHYNSVYNEIYTAHKKGDIYLWG